MITSISDYPPTEALQILCTICNKIYIARNITLDQNAILEQLKEIDKLFRTNDKFQ